jgi:lycopene cyclase domain-containing protein
MPTKYTYLLVDFLCVIFPVILSFVSKAKFYKQVKYIMAPCALTASFFITWDMIFTHLNVWAFNPKYVLGIYFFNLPLEEILFFICIPYACVFTYFLVKTFLDVSRFKTATAYFSWAIMALLFSLAIFNYTKLYTSITFFILGIFLLILTMKKAAFLPNLFLAYLFILFPFFISNGILTGSFINEPVVIYNNIQNLGIRMFTIPFEDTFYGMLLVLMNVSLYEKRLSLG